MPTVKVFLRVKLGDKYPYYAAIQLAHPSFLS
jgi:hypothetical protein